jgi:NADH dehydrogenase FAD-containing subunit
MVETRKKKRLVLVGGGHVHLLTLKNTDRFVAEGFEVILIGPDRFHYYSGMGPGMVSRIYRPEQVRFDVKTMVESRGGGFVKDRVVSIHGKNKTLELQEGQRISYDVVSFNIGSHVPMDRVPGAEGVAFPVKPIENLESARSRILEKCKSGVPRILIVGAGPAGVELAGNIWRLIHNQGSKSEITLLNSRDRVLPALHRKVSVLAQQSLTGRGIHLVSGFRVVSIESGVARSESGEEVPFDEVILTTGIMPQKIFAESELETSDDGALLVNECLQSTSFPDVFGGGDCIAIRGHHLDRVGVYAVREAPILFQNLLAGLKGQALATFKPQKTYLLILNLGDGTGLLVWGPWVWRGKLAFTFKNYLDTKFMSRFQVSGEAE